MIIVELVGAEAPAVFLSLRGRSPRQSVFFLFKPLHKLKIL